MAGTTNNWHQFVPDFSMSPNEFFAELVSKVTEEGLQMSSPKRSAFGAGLSGKREYLVLRSGRNYIHVGALPVKSGTLVSGWTSTKTSTGFMSVLINIGNLLGRIPVVGSAFKSLFHKLAQAAEPKENLFQLDDRYLFFHVVKSCIVKITGQEAGISGIRDNRPTI